MESMRSCMICYEELSVTNPLSNWDFLKIEDLRKTPCILISSREQQNTEQKTRGGISDEYDSGFQKRS